MLFFSGILFLDPEKSEIMRASYSGKHLLNIAIYLILFILLFAAIKIKAQDQKSQPGGRYDVHKEVDKDGNITRYDSVYSYSYSGSGEEINIDSLLKNMHLNFSFDFDDDLFFHDSFPDFSRHFEHDFNFYFNEQYFKNLDEYLKEQNQLFEKYFREEQNNTVPQSKPQNFSPAPGNSKDTKI